jgi:hypothetical protein
MVERVNVKRAVLALLPFSVLVAALAAGALSWHRGGENAAAITKRRPTSGRGDGAIAARNRAVESYGKLPVSFEPNLGQFDRRVKFASRDAGYRLFLTDTGAVLSLGLPAQGAAFGVVRFPRVDRGGVSSQPAGRTVSGPGQVLTRRMAAAADA